MSTQNLPESPSAAPARPVRHVLQRSATEVMGDKVRKRLDDDETPTLPQIQTQAQAQAQAQAHRMRRSVDVPRSGPVTPIISPIHSRRASLLISKDGDDKLDFGRLGREERDRDRDNKDKEKEKVKVKEKLQKNKENDKEKASSSTDGLRQSLTELSSFSTETTRQLDQTHYALLEKTSSLQVMVKALKDLAQASCDLQEGFDMAARELETDVTEQLRGIGHFASQQSTIETLQSRIHLGRQTADKLAQRVDVVRKQIEGWERADRAWQEKTRKRLRLIWAALLVLVCIVGLLFMAFSYNARGAAAQVSPGARGAWRNTTPEFKGQHQSVEQVLAANNHDDKPETTRAWETPLADEPLRIFDEL
ncbi:uncharacterized protein Triagg1_3058 [Trichoderma aggressivum f. europaeum]|uniref:Uncharacterized protein n=1 Tax=Trichoderma aggressivum f. europaeum TaxID=173218 RepID=A0AAE1IHZ7_9HYPO|nr:hypothetical protein Triagg1_3058 [Trichoderma aggressivum f. europaeum]